MKGAISEKNWEAVAANNNGCYIFHIVFNPKNFEIGVLTNGFLFSVTEGVILSSYWNITSRSEWLINTKNTAVLWKYFFIGMFIRQYHISVKQTMSVDSEQKKFWRLGWLGMVLPSKRGCKVQRLRQLQLKQRKGDRIWLSWILFTPVVLDVPAGELWAVVGDL